jgi:hypothetical protein
MGEYVVLEKKQVLPLPTGTAPTDAILADALMQIRAEARPHPASWWVSKLKGKPLRTAVMSALVASGALTRVDRTVLGLFPSVSYPEVDGATETVLRDQISAVLAGTSAPTPSSAALIALLDASGALRKQFGRIPKETVRQITAGDWAAPAVKAAMDEIAVIVMMTATNATSTAATAS